MVEEKLYLYNNVFTILLLLGIMLISVSFLFFVTSNLMTYFKTSFKMDKKKSKDKKDENPKKRNKDVYSKSGNLKEIDYNKRHEIINPSESLGRELTGSLANNSNDIIDNYGVEAEDFSKFYDDDGSSETTFLEEEGSEETTNLYDDGSSETTYLSKDEPAYKNEIMDDIDGENETTFLNEDEYEFNIEKIDYDDIPCNSDFYEDMIERDYFDDLSLDTGTLLLEDSGEGETSLLSENNNSLNDQVKDNRKWSGKLTQFDLMDGESVVVVSSKEEL